MATPQGGIFTEGTSFHNFLEYDVLDGCDAALVPDGETSAGGAFVVTQKWVHDLPKFEALPVGDQERVTGRTKPDSIELEGDAMPPDSDVSRTDVKLHGTALKIFRRSAPFGGAGEKALYFIAFSCDPMRFDVMHAMHVRHIGR